MLLTMDPAWPDDVDPLVTEPVIKRTLPGDHPLPIIPPLHEQILIASARIAERLAAAPKPPGFRRRRGEVAPGSCTDVVLTYLRSVHPAGVEGAALWRWTQSHHSGRNWTRSTHQSALVKLMGMGLVTSGFNGGNRRRYFAAPAVVESAVA